MLLLYLSQVPLDPVVHKIQLQSCSSPLSPSALGSSRDLWLCSCDALLFGLVRQTSLVANATWS